MQVNHIQAGIPINNFNRPNSTDSTTMPNFRANIVLPKRIGAQTTETIQSSFWGKIAESMEKLFKSRRTQKSDERKNSVQTSIIHTSFFNKSSALKQTFSNNSLKIEIDKNPDLAIYNYYGKGFHLKEIIGRMKDGKLGEVLELNDHGFMLYDRKEAGGVTILYNDDDIYDYDGLNMHIELTSGGELRFKSSSQDQFSHDVEYAFNINNLKQYGISKKDVWERLSGEDNKLHAWRDAEELNCLAHCKGICREKVIERINLLEERIDNYNNLKSIKYDSYLQAELNKVLNDLRHIGKYALKIQREYTN
ncbi:MAG: hypothetical protein MJ237_07335 [bacterium]|nr:hypothetical protein [bacterium]